MANIRTGNDTELSRVAEVLLSSATLLAVLGLGSGVVAQTTGSDEPPTPEANPGPTGDGEAEEPSLRERLEYALSGYHFEPNRGALDELGPSERLAEILRTIASEPSTRPSLRARAVSVLALYPSDETESLLESFLSPPKSEWSEDRRRAYRAIRLHAITSIAEMLDGERAVDRLEGLLEVDDLQVRLMAVSALGRDGGEPGEDRLRKLAEQTESEEVLREIRKFVDVP